LLTRITRYMAIIVMLTAFGFGAVTVHAEDKCLPPAGWWNPDDDNRLASDALLDDISSTDIVMLGERHDSAAHHRWQLETLKALHQRRGDIVLALEMFPRRVQPVLHAWTAGALDESTFLRRSEWDDVWGFDADLYMDIFRYARAHGMPIYALNVDAELTRAIGRDGLAAVPNEQREGVSQPAEPPADYAEWLGDIHEQHSHAGHDSDPDNFIDAQLFWDRAFAERMAQAHRTHGGALVVGLIGSGHLRHGHGVPHQLDELGVDEHVTLLPWDQDSGCHHLQSGVADAVYIIRE